MTAFLSFDVFLAVLFGLAALGALFGLIQIARFLPVTGDNMYPEASNMVVAQRWALGLPLYGDPREPPYLITGFPPLWFAALALGTKAGLSNLDSLTLFGRILSGASLLGAAWLGYLWARREAFEPKVAVLAPALFLSCPLLMPWAATARPDFPTLFFSAFAAFLAASRSSRGYAVVAALAAAAAFLVKHSSVATPTAIVLWMAHQRQWRNAVLFCIVWMVAVGTTLAAFQVSSGGLMSLNFLGHHFGVRSLTNVHDTLVRLWKPAGSGFSLMLLAFGLLGVAYAWERERGRLLVIYLLTSLGFAAFGSAVSAGNVNYYFESAWVLALLALYGVERLRRDWMPRSAPAVFSVVVVLVVLLPALDFQRWNAFGAGPPQFPAVGPMVKDKRILTDVPFLGARSARPELLDPVSHVNFELSGMWSSSGLVNTVIDGGYDLVVLHAPLDDPRWASARYLTFSQPVRDAIERRYGLCFEVDSVYVYGRRLETPVRAAPIECPSLANRSGS